MVERRSCSVKWILKTALSWYVLVLQGCGYRVGDLRPLLPAEIHTIAIPLFSNDTVEVGIETVVTEAFREHIGRFSSLRVVSHKARADAVLDGRIVAVSVRPVSFDHEFKAVEYEARITVSLALRSTGNDVILWRVDRLEDSQCFMATSDVLVVSDNRNEAYLKIARKISEHAVSRMVAGF